MTDLGRVLVIVSLIVVGAAACSDSTGANRTSQVEIVIEVSGGQTWSASQDAVESRLMCEGGSQRWTGYREQDGSPIDYDDATVLKQMEPALVLIETQLDCADGSGAISIAWEPHEDDRWTIVGGSGAYSDITGGGQLQKGDGELGGPITLRGEISSR